MSLWLVADLDGTLVPTPHSQGGRYLPVNESATFDGLQEWIRRGNNLLCVSTAGRRMLRQVWAPLSEIAKTPSAGRVLLCGFSGGALVDCGADGPRIVADYETFSNGTCVRSEHRVALKHRLADVVRDYFALLDSDETIIDALSSKYHDPFRRLLQQRRDVGAETFNRDVFTVENLIQRGKFLTATNDALLDEQLVAGLCPEDVTVPGDLVAQFCVTGVPMRHFDKIFTPTRCAELEAEFDVDCRSQPNSVVVARRGVDKATCVRYMSTTGFQGFKLSNAVAIGDCPASVDKPLTLFPEMPFVSLASTKTESGSPTAIIEVGDEERGAARWIDRFVEGLAAQDGNLGRALLDIARDAAERRVRNED